jgi:hypothetical protein
MMELVGFLLNSSIIKYKLPLLQPSKEISSLLVHVMRLQQLRMGFGFMFMAMWLMVGLNDLF